MSENKPQPGTVGWIDLTVEQAEEVRDFYKAVVGWQHQPVPMGGYDDFNMVVPGTNDATAGICHARGQNATLPTQWLIYVNVSDLDKSLEECRRLGGKVVAGPISMGGHGRFAVIQDPAGAVAAVFEAE